MGPVAPIKSCAIRGFALLLLALPAAAQEKKDDPEPIRVDEKAGKITFGARVAKQDVYAQLKGAIEYIVTLPGGKSYESLFVASVDPMELHGAMMKAGMKPGKPAYEDDDSKEHPPTGTKLHLFVEWKDGQKDRREAVETFVQDVLTGKAWEPIPWVFTGSRKGFDPASGTQKLQVISMKNLVSLYQSDATVLVQPGEKAKDEHEFKANKAILPKEGTFVRIVFEKSGD
jgi:hypothetical protein